MKALLYWHTLRHLKRVQIVGRIAHRFRRLDLRAPAGLVTRPSLHPVGIDPWRACALDESGGFSFLNERRTLPPAGGWNDSSAPKLWLYNLHYFDWINAFAPSPGGPPPSEVVCAWMLRWIRENPAAMGNGWEPYPLSLRIVNWIKWWSAQPGLDGAGAREISASLGLQACLLAQQVETHLLGNHLVENAKTLVFAGCFFEGATAERWFARGAKILDAELDEQILDDGGYFELSPMYHAIVLEGVLDLLHLQLAYPSLPWQACRLPPARLWAKARAMLQWLHAMTHPDGEIALFNDAAFGVAANLARLWRYAESLGFEMPAQATCDGIRHLAASGYVRVDRGPSSAMLDTARVGPDYLPGHAHADTLSFEWSLDGQRVFVNSGTSVYGVGPERLRQRGTAAHNTVVVDGHDSSEVWSGFRVARRAYPGAVDINSDAPVWHVSGSHDGYRRLAGRVLHRRRWEFGANTLLVSDHLDGGHTEARARYHLHPDVGVSLTDLQCGHLILPGGCTVTFRVIKGTASLAETSYHPQFGQSVSNRCLVLTLVAGEGVVQFEF